jgi:hypothetical protein
MIYITVLTYLSGRKDDDSQRTILIGPFLTHISIMVESLSPSLYLGMGYGIIVPKYFPVRTPVDA